MTTDLILQWANVQRGDTALTGSGGLVYVTENHVRPQEGRPAFLIAHVRGLHVTEDGTVTDIDTGLSPSAGQLTAVRRTGSPMTVQTEMRLNSGEDWTIRPDTRPGRAEDGQKPDQKYFAKFETDAHTGQRIGVATLRRVGWLDQKGRVWMTVPPMVLFDGGSLTPLLIDTREDGH